MAEENKTDITEKLIELTKRNEELETKVRAFEDAAKTYNDCIAEKDREISKLNKMLVDNLYTRKNPNIEGEPDRDPLDAYADAIKKNRRQ